MVFSTVSVFVNHPTLIGGMAHLPIIRQYTTGHENAHKILNVSNLHYDDSNESDLRKS
jgi:hypothetical protein